MIPNFTDRARRYVNQSPQTKKLSDFAKQRLIRGIAAMLSRAYKEGKGILDVVKPVLLIILLIAGCVVKPSKPLTMRQKQFELQRRLKTGEPLNGLDAVGDEWIVICKKGKR